jgi:hypothetical protein
LDIFHYDMFLSKNDSKLAMSQIIYFLADSKVTSEVACGDFKDEGYSCVPKSQCSISNCGTNELSDEPEIRSGNQKFNCILSA